MEEDLVLALAGFLLADVLERVTQGLNGRLERNLDVTTLELQAVDLALNILEPRLRLLEEQIGSALSVADDAPCLFFGVRLDVICQLLRRRKGGLQVLLVLAVLGEQRFHA